MIVATIAMPISDPPAYQEEQKATELLGSEKNRKRN
jgi:hypothetical protein